MQNSTERLPIARTVPLKGEMHTINCVHCRTPLDADTPICPSCGKNSQATPLSQSFTKAAAPTSKGVGWGTITLVVLSVILAGAGFVNLSEATLGVGGIALACWFAILARMSQAGDHRLGK